MRSGNAIASFARREPKLQKILQQIRVLTTQISRERAAKRASFRHRTHLPTQPRAVSTIQRFATTPAGFVVCCASHTQKFCNEFGNFCAENLHDLGGVGVCTQFFALPNAAPTQASLSENTPLLQARLCQTSRVFCSARSRNSRKFCNEFANFWLFVRGKFARSRC